LRVLQAYKIFMPDVHGGIPHVIATLTKLSTSGVENLVMVARGFGFGRKYQFEETPVWAASSIGTVASTPLAPTYPFAFARRASEFDLIVCHLPFPLADLGLLLRPRLRTPLLVYWHADIVGRPLLTRLISPLIKRTLRRADRIVVSHEAMIESRFLTPHANKCVVVPIGCDTAWWSTLSAANRDRVEELKNQYPRLVVAIGRLVSYKGYDVFLRAIAQTEAQAVIVGMGPLKADLEALAHRLNIRERVTFVGPQTADEIKCHLHAARMFVLPSVTEAEAFGIVQIEAMAAGRPVINTSLKTAVCQIARDEQEALTVTPRDEVGLADAISRLLADPVLAERLGQNGQQRARQLYDENDFLQKMHAIYAEVIGKAAARDLRET